MVSDDQMDGTASGMDAVEEVHSEQLPVSGAGIAENRSLDSVSNLQDVADAALASTLPQEPTINHESQIFVRASNRTVVLNVNLGCDGVKEVKRLIEEREGIPATEQLLFFGGKPLRHGTFLRDYDTLGVGSTIDVCLRVRGGNNHRTWNMKLRQLVDQVKPRQPLTRFASILVEGFRVEETRVLTDFGAKVLHGILTCVLSAHRAGLAYAGKCGMGDLMFYAHTDRLQTVVSLSVRCEIEPEWPLDDETQKEDYEALKVVIGELFPETETTPESRTQHVGDIRKVLDRLLAALEAGRDPDYYYDRKRRTHLLQAHAAMVSSPVAVATMCLNLKRFYDQFKKSHHDEEENNDVDSNPRFRFRKAMKQAQLGTRRLCDEVTRQPMFKEVYSFVPNKAAGNNNAGSLPSTQYEYDDRNKMPLFNFARNWFTHVPSQTWPTTPPMGLPYLDYIFMHHFPHFMSEALLQLYKQFPNDHSVLTEILVPLA